MDAGFSAREIKARMESIGQGPEDLDGILISHEHSDNTKGVGALSRKYKIPVHANKTTFSAARNLGKLHKKKIFDSHSDFELGDFSITPLVVPHDASEPNAFIIRKNKKKVTLATDLGTPTPIFFQEAENSDLFILESNYDKQMLLSGSYPPYLKKRILSDFGHLSNVTAARTLRQVTGSGSKQVLLAHISQNNNTPELALKSANKHLKDVKGLTVNVTFPFKCTDIIKI
jgi:phosphoribosyl 1,2-cyclic phosphodiesterase